MADLKPHHKDNEKDIHHFCGSLLSWYEKSARVLPWRYVRGETPDPYHVWLSEIMLQQTVVAAVKPYFEKFINKWPRVNDLAAAENEDVMAAWAGLGYYARARNLHKCAKVVTDEYGGVFPDTQEELLKLPGIGPYTSSAIAAIAFNRPAVVVDGNVERVMARQFAEQQPLPGSKKKLHEYAAYCASALKDHHGDYAQALMDLGATICIPKSPRCMICPVSKECRAFEMGIQADLPQKEPKKKKPFRAGFAYWVVNDRGEVLTQRRDEKEMMGGMLGIPTSAWQESTRSKGEKGHGIEHNYLFKNAAPQRLKGLEIHHSFTHFDLVLYLYGVTLKEAGGLDLSANTENYHWMSLNKVEKAGFPSLFKKIVNLMGDHGNSET